jgi:hypothetical protein
MPAPGEITGNVADAQTSALKLHRLLLEHLTWASSRMSKVFKGADWLVWAIEIPKPRFAFAGHRPSSRPAADPAYLFPRTVEAGRMAVFLDLHKLAVLPLTSLLFVGLPARRAPAWLAEPHGFGKR